MHYYAHHIDSYASATRHLLPLEDLAYRRMLDAYYRDEKPLQGDARAIARRIDLRDQAAEVQAVLEEFFTLTPDGWRQERCERELANYRQVVERNRANGGRGGRPKKPSGFPAGSQSVASGNPVATQQEPSGNPPNPNPIAAFAAAAYAAPVNDWPSGVSLPPESSGDDCGTSTRHGATNANATSENGGATTTPPPQRSPRSEAPRALPVACPSDVAPDIWADWVTFRKSKRAPVTERVLASTRKQAAAAGMTMDEALTHWVTQGYVGFFPTNKGGGGNGKKTGGQLWREANDGSSWNNEIIDIPNVLDGYVPLPLPPGYTE